MTAEISTEVEQVAARTARALGSAGEGLQAVELAMRTAMLHLGADMLETLLGADTGYRGPRVDCGAGHQAEFVAYRDKQLDTVLGRVTLRRAYYHCRTCQRGWCRATTSST